jgi:hypothetical protein
MGTRQVKANCFPGSVPDRRKQKYNREIVTKAIALYRVSA